MSTEQSSEDSVSAAIDAMDAKLFGADKPEQQQADADTPEAAESDEAADTADEQTDSADETEDDAPAVEANANEPNDPKQLRALMTRKTQEAAQLSELANDKLQFAEAREQFAASVVQEVADIKAMHAQLKQFEGFDLASLYNSDPGTALKLRDQRDDLRREIAQREQAIGKRAQALEAMQQQHHAKQWELAVKAVKERVGNITPADDMAMLRQAESLGFSLNEIRGRYADPRILQAIFKAAKYDAAQSGKAQALNTARQAPPVVKPGSTDPAMSAKMRDLNWSKQMKNAKTTKERNALAEAKLSKFFG